MDTPAWDTQFPIDVPCEIVGDKEMPNATEKQPTRLANICHMEF